ncbi:MAG: rod shape-determining protein MreB [Parcubacteria group bacterium Athens1014_10]|nr:MAG: rod shape-determining protein MreB [Parcubacteria group bacterium Athens1014_10]TSD04709.1 MAG: rod shape-determining protein MreB [Parcubacteria group bacterium Athens0714_12]
MFKKFFRRFSRDMGIDLGTVNTLVYVQDKGIIINESSVVAINIRTDQVLAVGEDAKKMLGKTPSHIIASSPLDEGVVKDFEVTERMLRYFIEKVHKENFGIAGRPRVVIGIPLEITEVEKKAVEDAALQAGARDVFLISEPMAAAIGARLPVHEPIGNLLVDIGGGLTEIAVISLGGIVNWKSLPIAGKALNKNIIDFCREKFSLLLGETTAEEIKIKIGSAYPFPKPLDLKVRGRDLITGLPKEIIISDEDVREALKKSVKTIVETIKDTIEITPPELVADIYERGIILSGGGALLKGLDKLIHKEIKIPVHVIDDPLTAVARGAGIVLEDLENLKYLLSPSTKE